MTHPERLPVPDDVLGAGADGAGGLVLDVDLDEHRPREDEVEVQAQVTLAQNHAPLVAPRIGGEGINDNFYKLCYLGYNHMYTMLRKFIKHYLCWKWYVCVTVLLHSGEGKINMPISTEGSSIPTRGPKTGSRGSVTFKRRVDFIVLNLHTLILLLLSRCI